jgi:hypothetical protein
MTNREAFTDGLSSATVALIIGRYFDTTNASKIADARIKFARPVGARIVIAQNYFGVIVPLLAANPPQASRLGAHIASTGPGRIGDDTAGRSTNDTACERAANRAAGDAADHASGRASNQRAAEHAILPRCFATGEHQSEGRNRENFTHRFSPSILLRQSY